MLWDPRRGAGVGSVGFGAGEMLGKQLWPRKLPSRGSCKCTKSPSWPKSPNRCPCVARGRWSRPGDSVTVQEPLWLQVWLFPLGGSVRPGGCSVLPSILWSRDFPLGRGRGGVTAFPLHLWGAGGAFGAGGPWGDAGSWGRGLGRTGPPPQDREALGGEGLPGAALTPLPSQGNGSGGSGDPPPPRCPGLSLRGEEPGRGRVTHLG